MNFIFSLHNIVSLHVKICREIAGNLDFRFFVHKHTYISLFVFLFSKEIAKIQISMKI